MIGTSAFPVRHRALPHAGRDSDVAIVRIRSAEQTVADWHMPRYGQQWASVDEAHREDGRVCDLCHQSGWSE